MKKTPTTLILLDGYGLASPGPGNAVSRARTPCLDRLFDRYAHVHLSASGPDVGLPQGWSGESEAGHASIAAGRAVPQAPARIDAALRDGSFRRNAVLLRAMDACREKGSALHLAGPLLCHDPSPVPALLEMAKERGCERVWVHAFLLSGGHGLPAADRLRQLEELCRTVGVGRIATVMGSSYAMAPEGDRDAAEQAYDTMVYGQGRLDGPPEILERSIREGAGREAAFGPAVCDPDGTISDHDSVLFFGVRRGRVRALARALSDPDFDAFTRQLFPLTVVSCADPGVPGVEAAFPAPPVPGTLSGHLSALGLAQSRIAGAGAPASFGIGAGAPLPGEDRLLIPSPDEDYDPRRDGELLCQTCVDRIASGAFDVIVAGIPDCDMAGHTGSLDAAVAAVEAVDARVGQIVDVTIKMGGIAMIASSHGNVERMLRPDGSGDPSNTVDPVPFILCGAARSLRPGRLADIAPTILDVMGLDPPDWMEGRTLIVE